MVHFLRKLPVWFHEWSYFYFELCFCRALYSVFALLDKGHSSPLSKRTVWCFRSTAWMRLRFTRKSLWQCQKSSPISSAKCSRLLLNSRSSLSRCRQSVCLNPKESFKRQIVMRRDKYNLPADSKPYKSGTGQILSFSLSIYHSRNSMIYRLCGVITSISIAGFCLANSFNNSFKLFFDFI